MTDKEKALMPAICENESDKIFFNIGIISKTLENYNIFVLYDNEKKPYSAYTKNKTDYTNKNNLCNYKYALNVLKNTSKFKGIGIVLGNTSKGNLTCLDIDDCINNKGEISDLAKELIELLDTYTEISQSGKGIHCLLFADKKGNACKNSNIDGCKCLELYDKNRYIALTGNCINDKNIEYRQEQCNLLYDKYFKKNDNFSNNVVENNTKFYVSKNYYDKSTISDYLDVIYKAMSKDNKLSNCWHGVNLGNDESFKDMALFGKLAHYTACNQSIMKELALLSPLFMQKDKKHIDKWLKRKDYLPRTIAKAISNHRRYVNE